ncbi:L-2,4-diaminobutyrate decarboxylase [Microbacterium terrae]|uniref:L-2,4-diaminobutyrate decarboxylase n=1 Tax=Microbacterium terrae TaxID=69369 RepID=A0A0M2HJV4_9MICO|nr:pyridoxal-dependent decarboxylase [Microbacterium terrae]KJL44640.1 L-2,4-diaminobutyrate decarboxylase [Microbacterium terrae]MBP1078625.1 L-2,4-diaminobutyrate decarboxylase [Microbacterium terrae]GLJ98026.1 pyridoxal-dependent decarboxylase [Microbacterium terrae]
MQELLTDRTAHRYRDLVADTASRVANRVAGARQPFSGAERADLQRLVDAVDLDAPGVGDTAALDEVDSLFLDNAVWFHHPGYAAHLNCPVVLPAIAAEAVLAAVNTSVDTYDQSTVGTLMERRLIDWTAERIGFPAGGGVFTSGGTQSNFHALFLAREAALGATTAPRREALPRLVVFATASSHFSVGKSALLLGLEDDAVVTVHDDGHGRMDAAALAAAIDAARAAGRIPMAVVATAGTTDRGVIDPVAAIAAVAEPRGVWVHVDAAYGCGLLVSPRRRHLIAGIERARSVTVDFHKSFFQPVSSSALVVREAVDLAAGAWHADYLNPLENAEPNQVDVSLQTTRRFDALKLWTTLRSMGPDRVGELFDTAIDLAAAVHDEIEADGELELVGRSQLSTVLFRVRPAAAPDDAARDALVAPVRRVLFESGRVLVAKTVIDGRPCLKLTLLNPATTLDDVREILRVVKDAATALAGIAGEASVDDLTNDLAGAGVTGEATA